MEKSEREGGISKEMLQIYFNEIESFPTNEELDTMISSVDEDGKCCHS